MKLVFCLPGDSFSKSWFCSWNDTIRWLYKNNIEYSTVNAYTPIVYNCRNWLLGGKGSPPNTFKPFNGTIEYDWIIWIDSDCIWKPADLERLISNNDHKVVTGFYMQYDNKHYAQAISFKATDTDNYTHLHWLEREQLNINGGRIKLGASGMGFMAVKAGVFESLTCPWFSPVPNEYENTFLSEDVSFCYKITQLGYSIWGDPKIQIQHEKLWLLSGDNIHGDKPNSLHLNQ
jgi:hypothetical protein